jgi:hypothetical protein
LRSEFGFACYFGNAPLDTELRMKSFLASLFLASITMYPSFSRASAVPDLFGIAPGMAIAEASNLALTQLHATKFIKFHFDNGRPAGFEAIMDGVSGGRSEAFRADTPMSGTVTFLSRAVAYGKDVGPLSEDLLRDLQAKYGRYSTKENVGDSLTVLVWYYTKDWQIEGSVAKECRSNTLKSDVSRALPIYTPPDKARNCDAFMRVAIQSDSVSKTVRNYSVTIFDEKRMYLETNPPATH